MSLSSDAIAESFEESNGTFLDGEESWGNGIASVAEIRRLASGKECTVSYVDGCHICGFARGLFADSEGGIDRVRNRRGKNMEIQGSIAGKSPERIPLSFLV
jgi:hypothetical protein